MSKKIEPGRFEQVRKALDIAKSLMDKHAEGAEAFMISVNVIKDGRIHHYYDYECFPAKDWGACMVAMGVEARRAELAAQTGSSKAR